MLQTPASTLPTSEIEFFHAEGYLVVRNFYPAPIVDEIRAAFTDQAKDGPVAGLSEMKYANTQYSSDDPLSFYPRMMNPHRHPDKKVGQLAMKYMLDPRLGAALSDLLGEDPVAAQSMFYFKPPKARGQALHQDNFYLRVKPGTCIAAWLAVDDADEENGGMVVVPKSNTMDIACPDQSDSSKFFTTEFVPVPAGLHEQPIKLNAGDMLFFNGSLIHGSYPNSSPNRFRRSLIFHYVPAACREVANWYKPLFAFDGTTLEKPVATGGGPCGTPQSQSAPH